MALTFTPIDHYVTGDREVRVVDVLFDGSYPSGGEAITAADLGFKNRITHIPDAVSLDGYIVHFDPSASKLKVFEAGTASAALDQVDGTELGSTSFRLAAVGR